MKYAGGYFCEKCGEIYPNDERFRSCPIHGGSSQFRPDRDPTLDIARAEKRLEPGVAIAHLDFEAYLEKRAAVAE